MGLVPCPGASPHYAFAIAPPRECPPMYHFLMFEIHLLHDLLRFHRNSHIKEHFESTQVMPHSFSIFLQEEEDKQQLRHYLDKNKAEYRRNGLYYRTT